MVRATLGVGSTMHLLKVFWHIPVPISSPTKQEDRGNSYFSPPPLKWHGYHKGLNVNSSNSQFKSDRHSNTLCKCIPEILMLTTWWKSYISRMIKVLSEITSENKIFFVK